MSNRRRKHTRFTDGHIRRAHDSLVIGHRLLSVHDGVHSQAKRQGTHGSSASERSSGLSGVDTHVHLARHDDPVGLANVGHQSVLSAVRLPAVLGCAIPMVNRHRRCVLRVVDPSRHLADVGDLLSTVTDARQCAHEQLERSMTRTTSH